MSQAGLSCYKFNITIYSSNLHQNYKSYIIGLYVVTQIIAIKALNELVGS